MKKKKIVSKLYMRIGFILRKETFPYFLFRNADFSYRELIILLGLFPTWHLPYRSLKNPLYLMEHLVFPRVF